MLEVTGSAGQIIAGRYRLEELVGQGGMGCVWRARHLSLDTPVAVKLVRQSIAGRQGMLDRFLREAKAAAVLRSVNVVQILDHGVDGGAPFIAMEYLNGESLASRLKRERKLGPAATVLVMTGVARALARAHKRGIIHRDLKPDNIFLARDEAGEVAKVLDFGIAKVLGSMALDSEERKSTETGTMLGTPCYMSPEQARGRKEIDTRSDLWSFAVIAFECLTGQRPFEADALGELMMQICSEPVPKPSSIAKVPPGFDAWFERATQRDPAARYQTVREASDALAAILTPGQRWVEVTADGEPSFDSDPGPISPFESQPTVPADTPPAAIEKPASAEEKPASAAPAPASPTEASARGPEGTASASARPRSRRALLLTAGAVAVVAAIGVAVSSQQKAGPTTESSVPAASAPAQGSPPATASAGAAPQITASALPSPGTAATVETATPPKATGPSVAALPPKASATSAATSKASPGRPPAPTTSTPAATKTDSPLPRESEAEFH